jgi:hypothetical protein
MRVFVKFYPNVDTIKLDVEPSASIGVFKQRLFEQTNLLPGDKLKVIVKNVPMPSDDVTLWDLEIKEDTTFHVVVQEQQNAPFKINEPHTLGALDGLNDVAIAHVLSFLTLQEIVTGTSCTCRKFRTVENQQQHIVWKPLASQSIQQHVRDEHKVKLSEFMASTKKKVNFKQLYLQRLFRGKIWQKIKEFSVVPQVPDQALSFEKEKQHKVKREPRPLSEEEEQFLQENDANALRRNLRKDKTAREKLRRHTVIATKKAEIESGVWKVVPQEFIQFDYDTLMSHSFGLHPSNNPEGITGLYDNQGRFSFINPEGKLLYLADIEPEDEYYRFKNVVVDETDERDPKDVIEHFFKIFALCKTHRAEEKKLLEIRVSDQGLKGFDGDAVGDVLLVTKKYDASAKSEKPKVDAKKPKPDEQGQITLQATQFVYKPNSDEENEATNNVNNTNVTEAYAAVFTAAHKDDDVATLGFQVIENSLLKKLGREADESSKDLIGKLLARGVIQFVKENNFVGKDELQEEAESTGPEESSGSKKVKKALEKLVILVKDQDELNLVKKGISTEFDLSH